MGGQIIAGYRAYNQDQREHGQPTVGYTQYLASSHFFEATFENWESEFLQMGAYVWLTVFLFQKGSAESKDPDAPPPRKSPAGPAALANAPWPVRRGGLVRTLYANSLSLAFAFLFLASIAIHAVSGARRYSEEQLAHGEPGLSAWDYVGSSQFWFESLQNWQSEFLAIGAMVVLSIYLRQNGSPESKELTSPHSKTGK